MVAGKGVAGKWRQWKWQKELQLEMEAAVYVRVE